MNEPEIYIPKPNQEQVRIFSTYRIIVFLFVFCCWLYPRRVPTARAQVRTNTRIVSKTELVETSVIIFDDKGGVATNLKKSDFRLFDDGIEQNILRLQRERVPVSFVVLADSSSSMRRKTPFVQDAVLSLVDFPQDPEKQKADEYSVLQISTRSKLLMPFTRDQKDIEKRLPFLLTPTDGSTALFDGIYLGVNTAADDATNAHSAMIIITDGGDNHSRYSLRDTKKMLEETDVPIFAIMAAPSLLLPAFLSPADKGSGSPLSDKQSTKVLQLPIARSTEDYIGPAERRGPHNMKVLTEASGGGVFTARHEEDLARIVRTIGLAVRYSYILTYEPTHEKNSTGDRSGPVGNPRLHKIFLELTPKDKFAGYSIPYYKRSYHSVD